MKNLHVIIPAAGIGSRMRPLSNGISKTLITLNGRPILDWIIESIKKIKENVIDITIVTNNSGDIKRFIETTYKGTDIYNKIKCIVQDNKYNGPGGAILSAIETIDKNDSYLIWLGDTVCKFTDENDFIYGKNIFVATATVDSNTSNRWCVAIKNKNNDILLYNKPNTKEIDSSIKTIDALIGIYYIPQYNNSLNILYSKYQNRTDEIQISELLINYLNVSNSKNKTNIDTIDVGNTWYDCGELDSYYESKARLLNLACREQSGIKVDINLGTVEKFSNSIDNKNKLKQEYEWFNTRKGNQRLFIPKIISSTDNSYTMELAPGNTLSDMFVYENIPVNIWKNILLKIVDIYHNYFAFVKNGNSVYENLIDATNVYENLIDNFYINRTCMRLLKNNNFYQSLTTDCNVQLCFNYITQFADELKKQYKNKYLKYKETNNSEFYPKNLIRVNNKSETFIANIHGDFHLGNILFDSLTGKFTFLDPRGGTMFFEYVDSYYDMAKIYHDLYCGYMLIIRGLYSIDKNNNIMFSEYYIENMNILIELLDNYLKNNYGYNTNLIKKLATIQLLSCIPFHKDNTKRCKGFLMRALNLINTI